MKSSRIWLLLLAFTGSLWLPVSARAQATSALERLEFALWPEYDRPAMLVIYRATLPTGTVLPASVVLPIPTEAGEPLAVAYVTDQGQLLLTPYTRMVSGEWASLTIEAPSKQIQVEYYLDLATDLPRREFTFRWAGGVVTGEAGYEVQLPAQSHDMTIDPPPTDTRAGVYGLSYAYGDLGPLTAASTFEITLAYGRETQALTSDLTTPPSPLTAPGAVQEAGPDWRALLPWGLLGLGGALLAGGAVFFVRTARSSRIPRRRSRPARTPQDMAAGEETTMVYCHTCGTQAGASDVFCRHCGTRLRE